MLSHRGVIIVLALLLLPFMAEGQHQPLADSLASIGSEYIERGNFKEAEFYLSEAVNMYQKNGTKDTTRYVDILFDLTESLYQRAKYDEAISRLNIIKPLVQENKDVGNLVLVHNYMGLILKYQSHYPAAQEQYQKALELAIQSNDSLMIAIIHDNLGGVNRALGDYPRALEHSKQALELFNNVGTDHNVAITLNNIGLVYNYLSMYDRAYDYFSRSLELSKTLDNTARLTTAYLNMGMVHYNLGNYDQALISYQKALEYVRQTGNPVKQGHLLVNLGNLYHQLGDSKKSLEYYQESLELVMAHNITSPAELSTKYKNIATRQVDLGQMEKARANYHKALEMRKKTGNIREIALSYLDIAQLERQRNALDNARKYAMRSKEIADSTQIGDLKVDVSVVLGSIQRDMGNPEKAIGYFRDAYHQGQSLSTQETLKPLSLLAHTFDDMESDSAIYYGNRLVETIESNRSKVGELSSLKSGFFEGYSDFYVDLASWVLKYHGDESRAFGLVEASRARSLLDELVQASQNLDQELSVETRLKKQQMLEAIETLQARIDTTPDPSQNRKIQSKLRDAELEYAAFMNQIRAQNPGYKKLEYPSPISAEAATALVGDQTAILEYAFAGDELLIFLITPGNIRVERVEIENASEKLTQLVERFRDQILAHAQPTVLETASNKLVPYLIEPFYSELAEYANLMIIPDEVLAYMPFEALRIEDRFLVEQFSVKYAPSMTTFSLLRDKKRQHTAHERQMLAIAGSNFGGTSSPLRRGEAYPPLPATLAEVDSIATKFADADVFREGNFSEQFVKENLSKNYRFIHLATHGIIDEDYPNLSGLALSSAPQEASGKEDGMLRSSEIYQLNINSDMVVLSACNTGLGKMVNGEGLLGLQRSFFYAGVPTVSVSLWNVYDRSTAYFMDQFYSALLTSGESEGSGWGWDSLLRWAGWDSSVPFGSAAPAMRQAKLQMINHPLFHHPVYWAPFVVLGR
ncbi:CHAT domain-containing tetratricopeptide repeat protein [Aliifodinibius sp. S!AR15-10]|uniref:CHAT domain-containing protein n=1 Tax=Aliifodinibius sp. S!AR15-10 TaxID=2950437 RepID=UPI0028589B71|nr:CHAT domain-containing tetratricopeptide repeat protein [Aliifodinibius sp. S!AR15-10]MDR8391353.1 CHAT domain-containing tetratricopeptide repeat protein [Aliifodinibius sp. S!AR15-10]